MKRGYFVGILLIGLCVAVSAYSLRGATVSHASFEQAAASRESCQVYGKLERNSIEMSQGMTRVRFHLVEEKTGERMEFLYNNPALPVAANFRTASHIRAVGTYDPREQVFVASELYTKCPSKYESEGYKAGGKSAPAGLEPAAAG